MADTLETYRTVTPYLVVRDADAELRFLAAAFGATEQLCHRNADNSVMHAEIRVGDSLIMLGQARDSAKARPASLYVWIPNVDEVYAKALAAGPPAQSAPEDKPYVHRNPGVADPRRIPWWPG